MFRKWVRQFICGYIAGESRRFAVGSEPAKACCLVCEILSGEYKFR